jgi:lipopolysaccharide transport system ATP-binding protein
MRPIAVHAEGVGKYYRIGQGGRQQHLRDVIAGAVTRPVRRLTGRPAPDLPHYGGEDHIWALRDVTFDIAQGEAVGFVGRNGAGKSTLLKILARVTEPTEGFIDLYGRVGSLLEVGTGFHTDLTGRENVYLNGAILGMRRREIQRKFDEIVAFSEVERFIDTPVKYYSSGMYMRLAFAVAAHLDPEILLVDEALAVGDAGFQQKCLGKMGDVSRSGRTVVFISHDMGAVKNLCERVFWLKDGQIANQGEPNRVIAQYLEQTYTTWSTREWDNPATAPGTADVRLRAARVYRNDGTPRDAMSVHDPLTIECDYVKLTPGTNVNLTFQVINENDVVVLEARPLHHPDETPGRGLPGVYRDSVEIPGDLLSACRHRVAVHIVRDRWTVVHREPEVLIFDIDDDWENRGGWFDRWPGAIRPRLSWRTELLPDRIASEHIQQLQDSAVAHRFARRD